MRKTNALPIIALSAMLFTGAVVAEESTLDIQDVEVNSAICKVITDNWMIASLEMGDYISNVNHYQWEDPRKSNPDYQKAIEFNNAMVDLQKGAVDYWQSAYNKHCN